MEGGHCDRADGHNRYHLEVNTVVTIVRSANNTMVSKLLSYNGNNSFDPTVITRNMVPLFWPNLIHGAMLIIYYYLT